MWFLWGGQLGLTEKQKVTKLKYWLVKMGELEIPA
jgi:hypothetical protein